MILESENIWRNLQSLVLNHPLIYDCTAYHKLHIEMTWLLNSEWKCRQNKMYIKTQGTQGTQTGLSTPTPQCCCNRKVHHHKCRCCEIWVSHNCIVIDLADVIIIIIIIIYTIIIFSVWSSLFQINFCKTKYNIYQSRFKMPSVRQKCFWFSGKFYHSCFSWFTLKKGPVFVMPFNFMKVNKTTNNTAISLK